MKLIIAIVLVAVAIGLSYYKFNELARPLPVPEVDVGKYWGPGDGAKYKPDTKIKPFTIKYSKEEIDDLHAQLNRPLKLTAPLEGINFEYGFNTLVMADLVAYWRDKYLPKWTEREAVLNELPHFTTEIQGLRIHFIHAKPKAETLKNKKVIPLLLLHGWPGSVREFYDFIPLLTESNEMSPYVFEVIAPSLVGYGWSQPAAKPGFDAAEMAIVMRNLMLRVGHEKFLIQGGDWGSIVGGLLSTLLPHNVLGYHSNMCILRTTLSTLKHAVASWYPEKFVPSRFFVDHHFPLMEKFERLIKETGYLHIQATKPDTIGTALQQNPVGLAAYILEKFQTVTGPSLCEKPNALATVYSLDALFDNVMIYYLTNTATTAARLYAETFSKAFTKLQTERMQSPVPMGCARFKHDLPSAFDWQLQDKWTNQIHSKYFQQGGHFAAFEVPVMLYIDFVEFVSKINFEK